jgi:hypothetical protein
MCNLNGGCCFKMKSGGFIWRWLFIVTKFSEDCIAGALEADDCYFLPQLRSVHDVVVSCHGVSNSRPFQS